jgi:hypothetical protein
MGEKTLLPSIYKNARSFSVFELIQIVKGLLPDTVIRWGSVVFFPLSCYPFVDFLEENIPVMKNPFGCFAGLAFPIVFTHTTIQHPIEKTIMNAVRPEQQGSR